MIVVGLGLGAATLVLTIKGFTDIDAHVNADGRPHQVSVDDSQTYLLWGRPSDPSDCVVRDGQTGGSLVRVGLGSTSYTRGSWEGLDTIEPIGESVEITCSEAGGDLEIGEKPSLRTFAGGLALGVGIPIVLGGAGFVMLLIIGILFATGAPRRRSV